MDTYFLICGVSGQNNLVKYKHNWSLSVPSHTYTHAHTHTRQNSVNMDNYVAFH